jgi:pyruvate, water dikinase
MFKYVVPLKTLSAEMVQEVGGKAANLGELFRIGCNVPPGFCVKGNVYPYLVESRKLAGQISHIAETIDFNKPIDIEEKTSLIRSLITNAHIEQELEEEIFQNWQALKSTIGDEPPVAVRSSVAIRGTTISSFPGLMDTYHYIFGYDRIVQKIKECMASVWTARAAFMRHHKKIDHTLAVIAPIVQVMIDSETAGVMFTANPMTKSINEMLINSCCGLGETVVSGEGFTDIYVLDKASLSVKSRNIPNKSDMLVLDQDKGWGTKKVQVPAEKIDNPTLTEEMLKELAMIGLRIEKHYGIPQDIEWAFCRGELHILQTRKAKV